jgi:fatty-acid desaturase
VQVLRAKIPTNPLEDFIGRNAWLGPLALSFINLICFGFFWGTVVSIINLGITPLFAVGGVNALAHFVGYRNYKIKDNSRNLGFIFPLNWIICGELDHNNHHRYPKSPSFRRRWFEFDIGYAYLLIFEKLGLAKIARNPWRYPLGKPISITPQSASPQIRVPGL